MELLTLILASRSGRVAEALPWAAGLFVFALAGGVLLYWLKRRMDRSFGEDGGRVDAQLIWKLRDEGQISDEEYHRLRRLTAGLPVESSAKAENGLRNGPPADDGNSGDAETDEESPRPNQEQE